MLSYRYAKISDDFWQFFFVVFCITVAIGTLDMRKASPWISNVDIKNTLEHCPDEKGTNPSNIHGTYGLRVYVQPSSL